MVFPGDVSNPRAGRQTTELGGAHTAVQVQLFTAHTIISGVLQLSYMRLSDQLNFGPPIVRLDQAHLLRGQPAEASGPPRTAYVCKDTILIALDVLSSDYTGGTAALREAKETISVQADLGHFVVSGALHLPRGVHVGEWLLEGRLFVPLTDAVIEGGAAGTVRHRSAIVNMRGLAGLLA